MKFWKFEETKFQLLQKKWIQRKNKHTAIKGKVEKEQKIKITKENGT